MSGNTEKLEDVKMEEVLEYQKIFKIENGFYQKLQALLILCPLACTFIWVSHNSRGYHGIFSGLKSSHHVNQGYKLIQVILQMTAKSVQYLVFAFNRYKHPYPHQL